MTGVNILAFFNVVASSQISPHFRCVKNASLVSGGKVNQKSIHAKFYDTKD